MSGMEVVRLLEAADNLSDVDFEDFFEVITDMAERRGTQSHSSRTTEERVMCWCGQEAVTVTGKCRKHAREDAESAGWWIH